MEGLAHAWITWASVVSLIEYWCPGLVWIEPIDCTSKFERLWTKVLFIYNAVVTDHEGFYASETVLCGKRDECEATDHHVFHNEVEFTKRCGWSLTFQYFEEVTVIRFGS